MEGSEGEPGVRGSGEHVTKEFEIVFCGKTMVRVTDIDGHMSVECWVPVPGAPDGSYWLGYTGPMRIPRYLSVDSFYKEGP